MVGLEGWAKRRAPRRMSSMISISQVKNHGLLLLTVNSLITIFFRCFMIPFFLEGLSPQVWKETSHCLAILFL